MDGAAYGRVGKGGGGRWGRYRVGGDDGGRPG